MFTSHSSPPSHSVDAGRACSHLTPHSPPPQLLGILCRRKDLGLDVRLERSVCVLLLQGKGASLPDVAGKHQDVGAGDSVGGLMLTTVRADIPFGKRLSHFVLFDNRSSNRSPDLKYLHPTRILQQSSVDAKEEQMAMEDWAQRWLEMAILPGFARQSASSPSSPSTAEDGGSVSVRDYLSSPKVALFNQVLRYANERNLRHVSENLQHMSQEALQQLAWLWRTSASGASAAITQAQSLLPHLQPPVAAAGRRGPPATEKATQAPEPEAGPTASSASGDKLTSRDGVALISSAFESPTASGDDYDDLMAAAAPMVASAAMAIEEASTISADVQRQPSRAATPSSPLVVGPRSTAPPPPWATQPDRAGVVRPRVTARIVDPTRPSAEVPGAARPHPRGVGGGLIESVASAVMLGAKVSAVAAVAVVAWAGGRQVLEGGAGSVTTTTVARQLRVMRHGAIASRSKSLPSSVSQVKQVGE